MVWPAQPPRPCVGLPRHAGVRRLLSWAAASRYQLIYDYLDGLRVKTKAGETGEYLFTAVPQGDAFTHEPSQNKEFMFIRTNRDRLTIVPTNNLLFEERSFTVDQGWPSLKRSSEIWSCE